MMGTEMLKDILGSWRPGHALPGDVYKDPQLYEKEIARIFLRAWLCVGHHSQIPQRGDFFLFEMAGESVILVRDADGQINALLNVCRHRGSRICDEAGHATRLTCRYHGWSYGLDGSLRTAAHMREGFDRSQLSLRKLHCRVFQGLIFINFAADPAPFDEYERDMAAPLAPYRLDRA